MKKDNNIKSELKEIAPSLADKLGQKDGFQLPDNYFTFLTESVMEQVTLEPTPIQPRAKSGLRKFSLLYNYKLIGSLAAIIVVAFAVFSIFLSEGHQQESIVLADISPEEAALYIENHIEDFEESLFIAVTPEESILEDQEQLYFNESEINEYLEDIIEEIDEETLEKLL